MELIETIEKIPNLYKLGAVVAVIVAILVGYYYMVHRPLNDEIAQLDKQIGTLDGKISQGLMMKGKLDQFRREYFVLRERMREAEEVLGNRPAVEVLLSNIASLANQTSLDVIQFMPQAERHHSFYGEQPVQLQIKGNYHELGRFFEKVANEKRIMNVTNITVKSGGRGGGSVGATCSLTTFWFLGG